MVPAFRFAPILASTSLPPAADDCGAAMFAAHLHTRFRATDAMGDSADLVLTHVHELVCDPSLEQFSLVFEGRGGHRLDGTCRFDHPALGRLTLFIASDTVTHPQRSLHQAAFNRRRDTRQEA
jgi:hypothetical protein